MFIIDIETIPQAREILENRMPPDIRNPEMPAELKSPEAVNWEEKAPSYSLPELRKRAGELEAAYQSIRNKPRPTKPQDAPQKLIAKWEKEIADLQEKEDAARAKAAEAMGKVNETQKRREEWIKDAKETAEAKLRAAREKWEADIQQARSKFIWDAALNAKLGHVKMIGFRDTVLRETQIFLWEPEVSVIRKIREWFRGLPNGGGDDPTPTMKLFRGGTLIIHEYRTEGALLKAFFATLFDALENTEGLGRIVRRGITSSKRVLTYYGNTFDIPFCYRRAWLTGNPVTQFWMRGNRLDEDVFIDLRERWNMGDREEKSGGLDALAYALGYPGAKTQDGGTFGEWYYKDPVEGVVYLINDLDVTEFCGEKTGLILPAPGAEKKV